MCEKFSKTRTYPSQAKNIPTCQKSALGEFQFVQSILNIQTYIAKSYISDYDIFINMSKTCTLNFLVYYSEKVFNMEYRIRLTHYSNEFRRQRSFEIQISHYCAFP